MKEKPFKKRIPVKALKTFANEQGLTKTILFASDGQLDHIVTWGKTIDQCSESADFGNSIKDLLGWPDFLHQQPSRIKKLQKRVKELELELNDTTSKIIELNILNYNTTYSYAPPAEKSLINTDDISTIKTAEARGIGEHSRVTMKNGDSFITEGSPSKINKLIGGGF